MDHRCISLIHFFYTPGGSSMPFADKVRETVKDEKSVLSKSTPITIALALALCAGAFYSGIQVTNLQAQTNYNATAIRENKEHIKETQKILDVSTRILNQITQQNQYTIERLKKLEDK